MGHSFLCSTWGGSGWGFVFQALTELDKQNGVMLAAKGELSEEAASQYERQRKAYDLLARTVVG